MSSSDRATRFREALVDALIREGDIRSPQVAAAMRAIPRHLFAPWLSLEEAYSDRAWIIPGTTPDAPATISQPTAVAWMLEGFDLAPGQRVLEIGAGTGYNAALMAYIVGPMGNVVTVDIEAWLVETSRQRLHAYSNVQVVHGDGGLGYQVGAPYDRIVATVGAWDVPPVWAEQLSPDGRLVIPLHLSGEPQDHDLISFQRGGPLLVGHGVCPLQMVLMRGVYGGHHTVVPMQSGPDWRGTTVQRLSVTVYPRDRKPELRHNEKIIEKPSAHLVLAEQAS